MPGPETFADLGFARVDTGRQSRQGAPEAVYAPGKTDDEIVAIVRRLLADNDGPVLVTRVAADVAARIRKTLPSGHDHPTARLLTWRPAPATVPLPKTPSALVRAGVPGVGNLGARCAGLSRSL